MMFDDAADPILRNISRLPVLTPSARRAERLRERCRAGLSRRDPQKSRALGPALVAGLCLLYVAAVVRDVLWLRTLP